MTETSIYRDIATRTDGAFMVGVVGPVRTGKSSFIKRFMETMIIPQIDNTYMRERAKDELPQSGSGKTIMTAEPKFVPEEAVTISLGGDGDMSVRLVDCVGYMVDGAAGQFEDGIERLVTTPWFDHEVTMTDAAEQGTHRVINEHSTIGVVITTDGSICDIPREKYIPPEDKVIRELLSIGKPFIVLLNSVEPEGEQARILADDIAEKYGVKCLPINCLRLTERDFCDIMQLILEEFPLHSVGINLPEWLEAMPDDCELKSSLYETLISAAEKADKIRDFEGIMEDIEKNDSVCEVRKCHQDLGTGEIVAVVELPRSLYYAAVSEKTGITVRSDGELLTTLAEMSAVKEDYDCIKEALENVRARGYGVVMPVSNQMQLEEPQIVRQGGKYSVKLKANAPAIHMFMTNIETEVTPAIAGENASEDIINFLLQGFDGDVNRIWQSNIFGKSLNDIAEEGLTAKIEALPENARIKLQETLQRIINEGSGGLICILL